MPSISLAEAAERRGKERLLTALRRGDVTAIAGSYRVETFRRNAAMRHRDDGIPEYGVKLDLAFWAEADVDFAASSGERIWTRLEDGDAVTRTARATGIFLDEAALDAVPAAPSKAIAAFTAGQEREAEREFEKIVKAAERPLSRGDAEERLRKAAPGLSHRAFGRIWAASAPDAWKKPGPKKNRRE